VVKVLRHCFAFGELTRLFYKLANKEATGAIQTVNAQYSYAPEYSGFRKQAGAVTSKKSLK
jgi:hypothetical protein